MVLAATLAHAHRWRHFTQLNLCPSNPFTDFIAARTGDTAPDGHELQWFRLGLLVTLTGGATLHYIISATAESIQLQLMQGFSNGPLENPWLMKWKQGKQYVAGHPWSGPPTPDPYL